MTVTFQKTCVFSVAEPRATQRKTEATWRVLHHIVVRTLYARRMFWEYSYISAYCLSYDILPRTNSNGVHEHSFTNRSRTPFMNNPSEPFMNNRSRTVHEQLFTNTVHEPFTNRSRTLFTNRAIGYLVLGTGYLVPSTCYQVLGTKYLVPSTWYQILGTRYLFPSSWYQVLGTK